MKYSLLNKDGEKLILTNTGFTGWIKSGEWHELNRALERNALPNCGCGSSYRSEFDEDVAKCFLNVERQLNPESGAYLVKCNAFPKDLGKNIVASIIMILIFFGVIGFLHGCSRE